MPYSRPGYMRYDVNGGTALTHGQPVKSAKGFVGVAVKQKSPNWDVAVTAQQTIAAAEPFAIISKGVVQVPFVAGFADGDRVYIDATNTLTETAAGNTAFGRVVEVAGERGTPSGKVRIDLDDKA